MKQARSASFLILILLSVFDLAFGGLTWSLRSAKHTEDAGLDTPKSNTEQDQTFDSSKVKASIFDAMKLDGVDMDETRAELNMDKFEQIPELNLGGIENEDAGEENDGERRTASTFVWKVTLDCYRYGYDYTGTSNTIYLAFFDSGSNQIGLGRFYGCSSSKTIDVVVTGTTSAVFLINYGTDAVYVDSLKFSIPSLGVSDTEYSDFCLSYDPYDFESLYWPTPIFSDGTWCTYYIFYSFS